MSKATESAEIRSLAQGSGFTGPNTLFPSILATVLLCGIVTTFFVAARLIAKRLVAKYDVEDYFLILAWIVNLAYAILLLVAGLNGLGHHIWDLIATELPSLSRLQLFSWLLEVIYIPAIWLAKSSFLFQLIHIFTPMKSGLIYWACHTLIWGNLTFYIAVLFTVVFECHPIDEVWNPDSFDHSGKCINRNAVLVATGAVNVFSDLSILLLPIWAIWHLQMAPKRKFGICAVFAIGILAFVSSICRLIYATYLDVPSGADISFIVAQVGLWALAEVTSVILCTCFPMMPRLVRLIFDRKAKSKSTPTAPLESARKIADGETPRTENIELGTWSPVDTHSSRNLLEQRPNVNLALP